VTAGLVPAADPVFDPFFAWLESTALSRWIVESPSLFAFPGILAAHTVGLGLLAGLNAALDLRLLGAADRIPPAAFIRVLPVMWFGLWVNVVTGLALLLAYPTKALTNPVFYLKLALIGVALGILRMLLTVVRSGEAIEPRTRALAAVSLGAWAAAIAAGRLLAYTCTRLTVEFGCT
jgi:hypothetical protein